MTEKELKDNKIEEGKIDVLNETETNNEINENSNIDADDKNNINEELESLIKDEEKPTEENLLDQIEQLRDEKLRLLAEMENLRKRSDRDKVDSIKYGCINLARDILSPDDNLSRALGAIPDDEKKSETVNNLIDGLKMVQKEFSTILEKHGVKKIETLKQKFDHNLHQAMVEIENDDVDPGTIIQEMQSGYTMHDRLLRPSMVGVSKKVQNDEKEVKND
jgi:molecular chaperone GrpE